MVSVIIPNYNHSIFLKERIESVLNQSYQDFEIILLDDLSTDDSKDVIKIYSENPKISHIVFNTSNSGSTFRQWEKGLILAKGDWIWIAESDDVAHPDFLEVVMEKTRIDRDIVCSFSASMEINAKGEELKKVDWAFNISPRNWNDDYINNGIEEIKNQFYYKCIIPNASAVIFRKSAVDLKVFDKIIKMRFAGDWLFWIKLLEKGKIAYSSRVLNKFRMHGHTTRSIKTSELEKQRFSESLSVIFYIRRRYNLSWDWDKHYWIINDWFYKLSSFSNKSSLAVLNLFPLAYKSKMIAKYILIKCKNMLR